MLWAAQQAIKATALARPRRMSVMMKSELTEHVDFNGLEPVSWRSHGRAPHLTPGRAALSPSPRTDWRAGQPLTLPSARPRAEVPTAPALRPHRERIGALPWTWT
jgi:hypothetical protein